MASLKDGRPLDGGGERPELVRPDAEVDRDGCFGYLAGGGE